jgi:hypothetical protein
MSFNTNFKQERTERKWFSGAVKPWASPVSSSAKGTFWAAARTACAPSTIELSRDIFAGAARARRAAALLLSARRVPKAVAGAKAYDVGAATRKRATNAVANLAILGNSINSIMTGLVYNNLTKKTGQKYP